MKSHSGAKKRFKANKAGTRIKRACMNKNHILNKKSRERKRKLRQGDYVASGQEKVIGTMIGTRVTPKVRTKTSEGVS